LIARSAKILVAAILLILPFFPTSVFALTGGQQAFLDTGQASNVMADGDFLNVPAMSLDQVQAFLVSKNSYLATYTDNSAAGQGRSAAQIIYDAAHGKYQAAGTLNGIVVNESTGTVNPGVILTYLQKEQSLAETTAATWASNPDGLAWALTAAMGYNCYAGVSGDNNGNNCKDIYEGFALQVENGAWQLRYNYERAAGHSFSDYQVGQVFATSDGYQVTLSNRAISSVYRYTPYVFNSAYNVWNIFYNRYGMGTSGISGVNDTTGATLATYTPTVWLSGGKASNSKVYYGSAIISDVGAISWFLTISTNLGATDFSIVYKDADDNQIGSKVVHIERRKTADINGDSLVDSTDLSIFAANWGANNPPYRWADLSGDSVVNAVDLSIFAANWGH
jgi:hypothetical protein